jgi:hypothetical protein
MLESGLRLAPLRCIMNSSIFPRFCYPLPTRGVPMKRVVLVFTLLAVLLLSSCSWNKVMKWIDQVDWERDDQTIRIVDFFLR